MDFVYLYNNLCLTSLLKFEHVEYVQYNENVYKDMCMQLMEDEQYIVLNTVHPELILPQTCAVVEFCGGGGSKPLS